MEEKENELNEEQAAEKAPDKKKSKKEKPKKDKPKKEHKKLKHGAMSTVYTIIVVAVVVLVNIIATILFDKYPITFDLTKGGKYSISEESQEYVKSIENEVTFKVFAPEDSFVAVNEYTKQADEVLKRYCEYNSNISVEYVDIDSNPDIVSDYSDLEIDSYSIIVETLSRDESGNVMKDESGEDMKRVRQVSLMDLIEFTDEFEQQIASYGDSYGQSISAEDYMLQMSGGSEIYALNMAVQYGVVGASTADQAFASALMGVTDPNPTVVSVLNGRDEAADISYLKKLLTANGYTVKDVDITSEEIPSDTTLAIIPAPTSDYMEAEIRKVDEYISNDGKMGHNLMYIASFYQQETPNIDELLEEYELAVGDGIVCESDTSHYYDAPICTIAEDISDSFAGDIDTENSNIIVYASRPVKMLKEGESGKMNIEAYVQSTDNAYVADKTNGEPIENGKQIYAAMSSKASFGDNGDTTYSNVFVIGADSIVSDTYLRYNQFQNREYILSVLNGMTGKTTAGIVIEPKVISATLFDITAEQIRALKIVFIGVIPLVTLGVGLFIWLRRKNR